MSALTLPDPEGYDSASQALVGLLAASLDDQLQRLERMTSGLQVEHLEWQERPGRNTIGMLLAHIAAVEIGWLQVGCAGLSYVDDATRVITEHLGIEDDGFPLAADGVHPGCLAGRTLGDYQRMLHQARAATHGMIREWSDETLAETWSQMGKTFSNRWVLYHLLEHFAAHLGQVCAIVHAMRDHQVAGLPEPSRNL